MDGLQAVIFDCDGVLVDSEDLGNRLLVTMLNRLGISIEESWALTAFRGVRLETCLELVERRARTKLPLDFLVEYRGRLLEEMQSSLKPVEGIEGLLRQISVPMCVASGATALVGRYFQPG